MISETGSARAAIREAACVVDAELSAMYNAKRDDDETIKLLKSEIRIMRQESSMLSDQLKMAIRTANESIIIMYGSCAAAFVAIGYVILMQ